MTDPDPDPGGQLSTGTDPPIRIHNTAFKVMNYFLLDLSSSVGRRPGPKFRAPFKASGSQASQPGPDQLTKTTKISEFPMAGRPVPQFLSSPPATQDESLPPAAAAQPGFSQVNSQSKCESPIRSFSTVSRAEYPSPPVQQREILLENPDICDVVHATGKKKMAKTKKGTRSLPVKKDKQIAAQKENSKVLGRATAHEEQPADNETKRPRRRPLSRMDDEENTTHSKMAAKKAKCQGTREHEPVSGSSQDYKSNVQLLTADTLTEEVVAAVQAAVEFCLAVQFQSGSTSFKCKTSLTQAVLWIQNVLF
jgi:hypothetical protein